MYIAFRTKRTDDPVIYEGLIDTKTGAIIARSCNVKNRIIEKRFNINNNTENFIILAAKEAIEKGGLK